MECPSMIALGLALVEGINIEEVQYGQLLALAAALPCVLLIQLLLFLF
jgi:hypothetical protein